MEYPITDSDLQQKLLDLYIARLAASEREVARQRDMRQAQYALLLQAGILPLDEELT